MRFTEMKKDLKESMPTAVVNMWSMKGGINKFGKVSVKSFDPQFDVDYVEAELQHLNVYNGIVDVKKAIYTKDRSGVWYKSISNYSYTLTLADMMTIREFL